MHTPKFSDKFFKIFPKMYAQKFSDKFFKTFPKMYAQKFSDKFFKTNISKNVKTSDSHFGGARPV